MNQPRKASASRKTKIGVCAAAIGKWLGGAKIEGGDHPVGHAHNLILLGEKWRATCPCCEQPLAVEDVALGRVAFHSLCACGTDRIVAALIRRGCWPNETTGVDPAGLKPRRAANKPPPEAKGVADPTPGPFLKWRRDVSASVAMAVLSPLGSWLLHRLKRKWLRPRRQPNEPLTLPMSQLVAQSRARWEAIVAAVRELEALRLVEVTHGGFDKAHGQCRSNLYRLTFVGAGCSDAWRAFESDDDTPEAQRQAEGRARAEVAAAETAAGARTKRARQRRDRKPWVRPVPTPPRDEWAGYEPDIDLSEPPDYAEPDFPETPDFGFSPTPPSEVGVDSTVGNTNKSPGREKESRERARTNGAEPVPRQSPPAGSLEPEGRVIAFPGRPSPDAMNAVASRIRMVEQVIANHVEMGRTRTEALAHLAKIGWIDLDSGWVFRPGYR